LLYYAPKIMASEGSVPFASGASFHQLDKPLKVKHTQLHRFGDDFAIEGYLRDPYEE
jgi:diaminohydroxyphosphoribosylaminopyrimidine deaminase / 5-amino-6-(5-phosphoribosylamino)uracil reductase